MCGVAGIFNYADSSRPVDQDLLRRMTARIAHRGPDGENYYISGPLGLGHRRLSILDLTADGEQPMRSSDGMASISYNGEIYDHLRVRRQLQTLGYTFRSSSDTATLLALLQHAGPDALATISGIFAFAYWDARAHRLLLARDAMGVKQLYYHDDGRRILFASEIKALLACADVQADLDLAALNEYVHFHTTLADSTFFRSIRQLRPAEYIAVGPTGRSHKIYWRIPAPRHPLIHPSPDEDVERLKTLLQEVVRDQTMADVPVGVYLSGGVDSSVITALARQNLSGLECYGVHFDDPGVVDERPYQEQVAKNLGLPLHLTSVHYQDFPDDFLRLMYFQDQPVVGPAMLPMYYLSRLACKSVKVCLGGQGADELFGGYARYSLAHPARAAVSLAVDATWGRLHNVRGTQPGVQGALIKQVSKRNLRRLAFSICQPSASRRYFANFVPVQESLWRSLASDSRWLSRDNAFAEFHASMQRSPFGDVGDKLLHWDARTYLPGLFHQEDRMSMANGIESRVPFADRRLVEFAFALSFDAKVRDGSTKWILRQAARNWVPKPVLTRRKVGFDTPVASWLKHAHRGFLREFLLESKAVSRNLWNPQALSRLIDNVSHPAWFDVIWKILCVEGWARNFLTSPTYHES